MCLQTKQKMKKQIPKIIILTLLLTLCLLKYNGCLNQNTTQKNTPTATQHKKTTAPTKEEKQIIQEKTTEFLEALKAEDIEQILKLSSKKALTSIINIPVDHIETYQIQEINQDQNTAQVETKINDTATTIIYLHKNPEWKVTNTLTP